MKIKLLFINGALVVGGKERQMIEIINNLDFEKYQQKLIIKEKNGYYFNLIDKDKCDVIDAKWKGYNFASYKGAFNYSKELIKTVNNYKPDYVISFSKEFSYLYSLSSLFFRHKNVFINLSIRDAPVIIDFKTKLGSYLYNFYKIVAANSEAGLRAYKQLGKKNRFVLYNGLNKNRIPHKSKSELRNELELGKDDFIVTFVGKQDNRKDHISFFKAIKLIQENYSELNIRFIVVGDGTESEKNKEFAKSIDIYDKTVFTGMSIEPEKFLKATDLNVLLSSYYHGEGIPNTVLESFACGTPVIATDNGGTKEIVRNDYNGFIIKNSDYKELSNKIIRLYNESELLEKFSKNAFATYQNKFTVTKMITNFENILAKIKNQ